MTCDNYPIKIERVKIVMHIQGREYRFEDQTITVAFFSNEPDLDFDEKAHQWLGDDWPFDDEFNDFESFTFRKARGILIVAVSNLSKDEMVTVNELVASSIDDRIRLLVCAAGKSYLAPQFNAVITTAYDLVNSIYDLAFLIRVASNSEEGTEVNIARLSMLVNQSRKGVLVAHWCGKKNMNLITPFDLVAEWPFPVNEAKSVVSLYTWLNPANCRWSKKTWKRFSEWFGGKLLNKKCICICASGNDKPVYSRNPAPDVLQLMMLSS
jgi:hypothetical protein